MNILHRILLLYINSTVLNTDKAVVSVAYRLQPAEVAHSGGCVPCIRPRHQQCLICCSCCFFHSYH